jgi:hypothetical protein
MRVCRQTASATSRNPSMRETRHRLQQKVRIAPRSNSCENVIEILHPFEPAHDPMISC